MPKISDAWVNAANAGNVYHITGRIDYYVEPGGVLIPEEFNHGSINFTDDNILEDSFQFSAASNEGGEFTTGGLVITAINFTIVNYDGALNFSGYKAQPYNGRLCLQINCKDLNGNTMYLDLPTYYISSLKENNGLVMIEAFDALDCMNSKPDASIIPSDNLTQADYLMSAICETCKPAPGGPGHTEGVEEILPPNYTATEIIDAKYLDLGKTTNAEILRYIASSHGFVLGLDVKAGSAPMTGNPPDQQMRRQWHRVQVAEDAIIAADIIDSPRQIGALRVYDYVDGAQFIEVTKSGISEYRKLSVSNNPFLFGAYKTRLANEALNNLWLGSSSEPLVSFNLTALCNPAIRPGDIVEFTYKSTRYETVVSAAEWTLGGYMTLSCNPQSTIDVGVGDTATWSESSLPMTPTISASIGTAGTSCATSTWLTQGSVTFEPGTYLILVNAFFSSNASGRRLMYFSDTSTGSALDGSVYDARMAVDGAASRLKFQTIKTFEASTTLYLRAWQNSGSTLTFTAEYSSIKIF